MESIIDSIDSKCSYKIEVSLHPSNNEYEPDKHFFWCLSGYVHNNHSDWCTENAGWSASPQEAFIEAYNYYQKYYCGKIDEQHLSPKISIKRKFWKGVVYE